MNYFIPLAYDRINPEKGTGTGTRARCRALISEVRRISAQDYSVFVSTAGYTKESPDKPTQEISKSLAEEIIEYVRDWNMNGIARPVAWGTYSEIATSFEEVAKYARDHHGWSMDIYLSTNSCHMPRVRLCVWFLKGIIDGYRPQFHFIPANHSFTPKEWVQETTKFFVYLYRFLFKKW